ncbi:hypothetical protein [Pseudodonghicola xiamenensis]|uniref:hypothetical protein n=1 Tax=Pseudodonghicola xiamenensis TaxID=337702 RepID=UPI000486FADD|nr:hypothetical protein [Pseudodonghicola xiamenensis]
MSPRDWAKAYPGPIHRHWRDLANEKGFDLVKRIRNKDHIALKCHRCGALTAQKLYTMRKAQPACAACQHTSIETNARIAGLSFLGYDPEKRHRGLFRAPCGHEVVRQFGLVQRIVEGRCRLRCETCHSAKEQEEATVRGWKLLGADPQGNQNYRLYRHACGAEQRIARANMQSGRFGCHGCGATWSAAQSYLYAIRLELPTGLRVMKLGFSRDPHSRLQHQLLLKPGIQAELLQTIQQASGHAAMCREKALHRKLKTEHPDAPVPAEHFRDWLSVKTEIYGIELERIILEHLNAIPEDCDA